MLHVVVGLLVAGAVALGTFLYFEISATVERYEACSHLTDLGDPGRAVIAQLADHANALNTDPSRYIRNGRITSHDLCSAAVTSLATTMPANAHGHMLECLAASTNADSARSCF